jgi:hypothetical protein
MIVFPKIDDIINELRGDKINNIIRTDAIPRHIHIFFVDFEYSIISCVLVKDCDDIIIYNIILL